MLGDVRSNRILIRIALKLAIEKDTRLSWSTKILMLQNILETYSINLIMSRN